MKILMLIRKINSSLRVAYKTSIFKKNTLMNKEALKTTKFGDHSNCHNSTGNKDSIHIGKNCDIHGIISANGNNAKINIGDFSTIRYGTQIRCVKSISIGNYVIISNNVIISDNNNHPTSPSIRKEMCLKGFYGDMWNWEKSDSSPIVICDNVWIGEGSTILKGVTINEGSIVACQSVVTKDVPPYTIVAGNPAREVKKIEKD